eukprot:2533839-Prymnesium_polylepis.1
MPRRRDEAAASDDSARRGRSLHERQLPAVLQHELQMGRIKDLADVLRCPVRASHAVVVHRSDAPIRLGTAEVVGTDLEPNVKGHGELVSRPSWHPHAAPPIREAQVVVLYAAAGSAQVATGWQVRDVWRERRAHPPHQPRVAAALGARHARHGR